MQLDISQYFNIIDHFIYWLLPEKDFDHIFDPVYTGKKKMGMGVGLSICHGIIENYNGSITAKNSPEGVAVFTISLPVS
jgi:signal transduction histidine kinase